MDVSIGDVKLSPEFLISRVRCYQCLYNPLNAYYKSRRNKNFCWEKIGQECNVEASVVKSKWKSLRDRYVRERKAEKAGTSKKEWNLFKCFSFLDPFVKLDSIPGAEEKLPIKSELSFAGRSEDESSAATDEDSIGHFLDMHSYSKPVHLSSTVSSPPSLPPPITTPAAVPAKPPQPFVYILPAPMSNAQPPPHVVTSTQVTAMPSSVQCLEPPTKRPKLTKNINSSHMEKRFLKYVHQHGLEEPEQEYTSDEMFVLSLVPSFNKLTEAKKDKLKLDMHKLVYDAVYASDD